MSEIKIEKPSQQKLKELGTDSWSPWECEPSVFDWEYDQEEWCYFFEGKVKVKTEAGKEVQIKAGDLVKLPKGLKCTWDVAEKVRKVYIFR